MKLIHNKLYFKPLKPDGDLLYLYYVFLQRLVILNFYKGKTSERFLHDLSGFYL